jgi:hypothetical protein
MQRRRNAAVERRASGRTSGPAVIVRGASVPKSVGEDGIHHCALEPRRRLEAGVVDSQLEPLRIKHALHAGTALVNVVLRSSVVVSVPQHPLTDAGTERVAHDCRLGRGVQSDAPEPPHTTHRQERTRLCIRGRIADVHAKHHAPRHWTGDTKTQAHAGARCDGTARAAIAHVECVVEQPGRRSSCRCWTDACHEEQDERELLHPPSRTTAARVSPRSAEIASSSGRAARSNIA